MPTALIIGSGPAAAGVALALTRDPKQQITVVDVGATLEPDLDRTRASIASTVETRWSEDAIALISHQPVAVDKSALPEKRSFGSNFPFRDVGQLAGIQTVDKANGSVVSGAYGGFSNVWGAQIMPFSRATFDGWPISANEMRLHYQIALQEMDLTGETDDLSTLFPLMIQPTPLPPLSDRAESVLSRYTNHRSRLQSLGITVGRARLAMRSGDCTRCGLCMTGCPYGLIYSASHTFDRLRSKGLVTYRGNLLATALSEQSSVPWVEVRDLTSGAVERLTADRIYVACGGIGSTRLVLGSIRKFDEPVMLGESVQFVMPAVSLRATTDPREQRNFTLNQFNLVYDSGGNGVDLSQIHFYPYNPIFEASLPGLLRHPWATPVVDANTSSKFCRSRLSPFLGVTQGPGHCDRNVGRRPTESSCGSRVRPGVAPNVPPASGCASACGTCTRPLASTPDDIHLACSKELPLRRIISSRCGSLGIDD